MRIQDTEDEIWAHTSSYKNLFIKYGVKLRVSSKGRVCVNEVIIKTHTTNKDGYAKVVIRNYDITKRVYLVHRLIADAFYGPLPKGYVIHHIDSNRTNNETSNLKYMTRGEHTLLHIKNRKKEERESKYPSENSK